MTVHYSTMTPLQIYRFVQESLRTQIIISRGAAITTVEQMTREHPAFAPFWLLPPGTPADARRVA